MRFLGKKVLLVLLVMGGCDDSGHHDVAFKQAGSSSTAIYFFDGTGIDFDLQPTKDVTLSNPKGRQYREVRYEFSQRYQNIDAEVKSILLEDGYSWKELKSDKDTHDIYYSKNGQGVLFRYSSVVVDGLKKKTTLMVWWYL